jgi:hypothetical protein
MSAARFNAIMAAFFAFAFAVLACESSPPRKCIREEQSLVPQTLFLFDGSSGFTPYTYYMPATVCAEYAPLDGG